MKIVVESNKYSPEPTFVAELREEFAQVDFVEVESPEEMQRELPNADAVYGTPDKESFRLAEGLRWIACPAVGVDYLMDRPDIVESEVILTNARAPGYNPHAEPLADHVFGMILIFAHRWRDLLADQKARRWAFGQYPGAFQEIAGSTMGILAAGAIGQAVARRAAGFGMEVYAVGKLLTPVPEGVKEVWPPERLDDMLRITDWLVVAAPFTHETRGLIDRRRLGLMKPTAHVIVISRGGIVDEQALIEALRSGGLAGAGMDVFEQEPLPQNSPLWDDERVIISPHTAHVTPVMPSGHREVFKENLRRFLADKPFLYVCDKRAGY